MKVHIGCWNLFLFSSPFGSQDAGDRPLSSRQENGPAYEARSEYTENSKFSNKMDQSDHSKKPTETSHTCSELTTFGPSL